jgi:hypothetical protein
MFTDNVCGFIAFNLNLNLFNSINPNLWIQNKSKEYMLVQVILA